MGILKMENLFTDIHGLLEDNQEFYFTFNKDGTGYCAILDMKNRAVLYYHGLTQIEDAINAIRFTKSLAN